MEAVTAKWQESKIATVCYDKMQFVLCLMHFKNIQNLELLSYMSTWLSCSLCVPLLVRGT